MRVSKTRLLAATAAATALTLSACAPGADEGEAADGGGTVEVGVITSETGPLAAWLGNAGWVEDVMEDPHEAGFVLMLGFVGLHMSALVFHHLRGERVAQSMVTGKQYIDAESGVQHD